MEAGKPVWPEPIPRVVEHVARAGGTVMLLGGVDSGKSTLAVELVNRGLEMGRRVAVVDADVGQSDIGPPTSIGLGFPSAPVACLAEVPAERLYFVGHTSPIGHLLPMVIGTARLARQARTHGCDLVVVDTTGLVSGRVAEVLKFYKIQAVRPRVLLALQASSELEHLLVPFEAPGGMHIVRLNVPPNVRPKSPEVRRERRRKAMARYLATAQPVVFDHTAVHLWPPISAVGLQRLRQRVCGLLNARGDTLALGILEEANPYALTVFAPVPNPEEVAIVQLGWLSITRDGEELE